MLNFSATPVPSKGPEITTMSPSGYAGLNQLKASSVDGAKGFTVNLERSFDEIERDVLEAAISHCNGSIPRAAEMLKLSPSTIYRKRDSWASK